jgi:hypothetical protein|tara:strand:- start:136 stop:363 length:228 start_codon:yes stop_codon:yes gene_type:complete
MNDSVIIVNSKKDLIEQGYITQNLNKEIIYEGHSFLLKVPGIKSNKNGMYNSIIIPVKPEWHLKLNDMIIEINII